MNNNIKLCAIVAMAENRVIGKDNSLIWHLPEDLKHFKKTTMNKPIIMGRKSFESLPGILPGRPHIIISRSANTGNTGHAKTAPLSPAAQNTPSLENASSPKNTPSPKTPSSALPPETHYVKSIDEGIHLARALAAQSGADEIFITGGGEIYKQTLPNIERLYLTVLHEEYEGDTHFPRLNWDEWDIIEDEEHPADPAKNRPAFTIFTLERK